MQLILSLITGFVCGAVFSVMGLPIPAPGVLAGILGIIGIYGGFVVVKLLMK